MSAQKKILIVDDGKENVSFFNIMLSKYGYEIYCAETEQAALELIRTAAPDIVLLDGALAQASDWSFLKRLKHDAGFDVWKDIPVIAFSASASIYDKYKAVQLGALDFITKPVSFEDMLMRLRLFFEKQDKRKNSVSAERKLKTLLSGVLSDMDVLAGAGPSCPADELKRLKDSYAEKLDEMDFSDVKLLEQNGKKKYTD